MLVTASHSGAVVVGGQGNAFHVSTSDVVLATSVKIATVLRQQLVGGEGNLRPRRPPREYLGEYTS